MGGGRQVEHRLLSLRRIGVRAGAPHFVGTSQGCRRIQAVLRQEVEHPGAVLQTLGDHVDDLAVLLVRPRMRITRLSKEGFYETTQEVVVTNVKKEVVTVELTGRFSGDWRMLDKSVPHEKKDSRMALWRLTGPAGGEVELDYRVRVDR